MLLMGAAGELNEEQRDMLDFLVHWFFQHTTREDRLFADYLHSLERA